MALAAPALHIDGDRVRIPAAAFEHAGFRAWVTSPDFPENARAAFMDGEVLVEVSPEAIETHNKMKTAVTVVLGRIVSAEGLGEAWSDGALFTNESALLSTEPDFSFASFASLEAGHIAFVQKADRTDEFVEIVGAPDLVVEVVSDSSQRKDLEWLRLGYARAGVREYWLIDARGETLRFEILELREGEYQAVAPSGAPQRSPSLAREFVLERARNRAGRWSYVLRVVE